MRERNRKLLSGILTAVLAFSILMMVRQALDNSEGSQVYDAALQAAVSSRETVTPTLPEETEPPATEPPKKTVWVPAAVEDGDPVMEELKTVDLDALRETNPDVIGWIRIPETKIDYPIMQGMDNDYYLNHTWNNHRNSVGSIFMEYQNDPGLGDYNTLIYGHNMKDGSMFAKLRSYADQSFFESHPYVYLVTDAGILRYEIFSSYKADIDSPAYGLSFRQQETREAFLAAAMESSAITTGISPGIRDRILTLSTCSAAGYSTRWVVHARLKMVKTEI